MTRPHQPGQGSAGSGAGRQGNGTHSLDYPQPAGPVEETVADPELIASPGHGSVAVFQAPQPVRARTEHALAVPGHMDIDSPFLDLFVAAAPARPTIPAPASPTISAPASPNGGPPRAEAGPAVDVDDDPLVDLDGPAEPVTAPPAIGTPTPPPFMPPAAVILLSRPHFMLLATA